MEKRIFDVYDGLKIERSLPELCLGLFARQIGSWPAIRVAYETLRSARQRVIAGEGFSFSLQFNPARVISSEARIDAASIESRPCFLCGAHLPEDQIAILYRDAFVILCNPFPIFEPHFTIADCHHVPQSIEHHAAVFLQLARDFSPRFSVFYNGAKTGASAPDHLHFQGCPVGAIPVETEAVDEKGRFVTRIAGVSVFTFNRPGRRFLRLEGGNADALADVLTTTMKALKRLTDSEGEAMVNILASFGNGHWRVFIFPRRRHRPEAFSRAGDDRRAITPGTVEMGGLVITTNDRDFTKLDYQQLVDIFEDVSVDEKILEGAANDLLTCRG